MALMDIFNGFRGTTSAPAANPAATTPPGGTVASNPTVPSGSTVVPDGSNPAFPAVSSDPDKSPLDGFKDLWKIDDKSKAAVPTLSPVLNVEPTKIMEAARQIDFTKGVDTTLVDKATKGDAAAFMNVINTVAQNAFAQGAAATTRIVDTGFKAQENNFNKSVMPDILRRHSIKEAVAETPLANNPATAPLIGMLEQALTAKFPTAAASEIKSQATKFLDEFATSIIQNNGGTIVPKISGSDNNPLVQKETDWGVFFGEGNMSS